MIISIFYLLTIVQSEENNQKLNEFQRNTYIQQSSFYPRLLQAISKCAYYGCENGGECTDDGCRCNQVSSIYAGEYCQGEAYEFQNLSKQQFQVQVDTRVYKYLNFSNFGKNSTVNLNFETTSQKGCYIIEYSNEKIYVREQAKQVKLKKPISLSYDLRKYYPHERITYEFYCFEYSETIYLTIIEKKEQNIQNSEVNSNNNNQTKQSSKTQEDQIYSQNNFNNNNLTNYYSETYQNQRNIINVKTEDLMNIFIAQLSCLGIILLIITGLFYLIKNKLICLVQILKHSSNDLTKIQILAEEKKNLIDQKCTICNECLMNGKQLYQLSSTVIHLECHQKKKQKFSLIQFYINLINIQQQFYYIKNDDDFTFQTQYNK